MSFNQAEVNDLLIRCHRRCCICHRFCGVKMETDHLIPKADEGPDDIDNCLPVCFECHAEIHSYNDKHPRGRKFRPEELRGHREQWLEICRTRPEVFTEPARDADVGPLQALIDELEFNAEIAGRTHGDQMGCPFYDEQFRRAIQFGAISIVYPELKTAIIQAYAEMGKVNHLLLSWSNASMIHDRVEQQKDIMRMLAESSPKITFAHTELLKFLGRPMSDS
jgi:hypothetical protein